MKRSRNPQLKRRKIIEATQQILKAGGYFTNFSLDSVAKMAGVSKGGLIHHFESKEVLLRAAAQDAIEGFETQLAREMKSAEITPTPMLRAYIQVVLGENATHRAELSPILLSYLNADQNEPNRFQTWQARAEQDNIDIITATIVRLAVDGLLYTELIDNQQIDPILRRQVRERLVAMLDAGSVDDPAG